MEDPSLPPPNSVEAEASAASHAPPTTHDFQPPSVEAHPPLASMEEAHQPPPPPPASRETQPPAVTQQPTPPSTATPDPLCKGRKRPLECDIQIENSEYFKMRVILRDLRPHFLEVIRTLDFKNCEAAREIREKMKLMLELHQRMTIQTGKSEVGLKSRFIPNGNIFNRTPQDSSMKSSETQSFQTGNQSEKHHPGGNDSAGGHVVGGSAFGWNFVTHGGTEPLYYGRTKEEYRSIHPIT